MLLTNSVPFGSSYAPSQIRTYLGLSGDGSGQTIAIVAAFDDPNIVGDVNVFSAQYCLPGVCGTTAVDPANCFNFTKAALGSPPADGGWSLEIALDVEWAHAVAPKASILLVEATSDAL